jgi:hypothetical protein
MYNVTKWHDVGLILDIDVYNYLVVILNLCLLWMKLICGKINLGRITGVQCILALSDA